LLTVAACGPVQFPRQTTANNTRTDDPWLEGRRCEAGPIDTSGLRVETVEPGPGKVIGDGDTVRVHYVARLTDGTVLHDTRRDAVAPIEIIVGSTKVICGFEKALLGMRAGEQRRATVPWQLAFGEAGKSPAVPPHADVEFLIDLYVPEMSGAEPRSAPVRPGGGGNMRGPR
jgi:FKBP-type peptidyl-prolyl cis-trans isomerase